MWFVLSSRCFRLLYFVWCSVVCVCVCVCLFASMFVFVDWVLLCVCFRVACLFVRSHFRALFLVALIYALLLLVAFSVLCFEQMTHCIVSLRFMLNVASALPRHVWAMASRYRRLDEGCGRGAVAAGSFGRVYAAVDLQTQTTVALKRQRLPSDACSKELSFYKTLGQNEHPRVMRLLDHFVVDRSDSRSSQASSQCKTETYLYMVFDFMDCTLWHYWETRRRMVSPESSHRFILHAASGVAHLHEMGIVHTDLSMANLLLNHGELRVADLGGAATAADLVFKKQEVVTTVYARAPEVFLGARHLSSAIDVWSLGVCGMALLTGSLVFWEGPGLEPKPDERRDAILANLVAFLGSVSPEAWPGCYELALFTESRAVLEGPGMRNSPADFLADSSLVRRCMDSSDPAVDLLVAALRWDPARRLRAKDWLSHAFLSQPLQSSLIARTLVAALSPDRLRQAVLQSMVSGQAVTMESLCAGADVECLCAGADAHVAKPLAAQAAQIVLSEDATIKQPVAKRLRVKTSMGRSIPRASSQIDSDLAQRASSQIDSDLAQASSQVDGGAVLHCACRGNCGQKDCKANKNKHHRGHAPPTADAVFCHRTPSGGNQFCMFCKCESCSGSRQQNHAGQGRWCSSCARSYVRATSRCTYHNQYGTRRVGSAWSLELQLAARYAWVTNLTPPEDGQAWMDFVDRFLQWRQESSLSKLIEPGDWLFLVVIACARWPTVVRASLSMLAGFEPRTASPAQWHEYLCRLLRWASGHPWDEMFYNITPGRTRCCSGLVWLCKRIGVVACGDDEASMTERDEVQLGSSQSSYIILDAASSAQRISDMMRVVEETTPALRNAFVGGLRAKSGHVLVSDIRTLGQRVSDLAGGVLGHRSVYGRGAVARSLLKIVERECGVAVWDDLPMSDIIAWVPDKNGHCAPLHSWRGSEVRDRFGMSPLQVSSWACMWGFVPKVHLKALDDVAPCDILNLITSMGITRRDQSPSRIAGAAGFEPRWPQPHEWVVKLASS